jgi:hypothetical protein
VVIDLDPQASAAGWKDFGARGELSCLGGRAGEYAGDLAREWEPQRPGGVVGEKWDDRLSMF